MPDQPSQTENAEPTWVGDVMHFWFEELSEADWFKKSDDIDGRIRDRFSSLYEQLAASNSHGDNTPRSLLAAVIVLDQFSRNLFRGSPRAFAADPIARRLARSAIAQGFDTTMTTPERLFFYLPFEHSENLGDQVFAVSLIQTLGNADWMHYTTAHKMIIEQFGRFPHRNAVLGRLSTAEEIEFLKAPMSSF